MYDHVRSDNYDFNNCLHLACSEVRAAKLSGQCKHSFSYVYSKVNPNWNTDKNYSCVKQNANENMIKYYDHCASNVSFINKIIT